MSILAGAFGMAGFTVLTAAGRSGHGWLNGQMVL
jgi:hypothetical protein